MRRLILSALAGISAFIATPASAALVQVAACDRFQPNPDASACAGAYAGNLNNNASIADLNAALDVLVGGNFSPDAVWSALDPTKLMFSAGSGTTVNFSNTLFGQNILSIHFGDAGSGLGNHTILYLFDFGVNGATSVDLNRQGFSNAVLVQAPIPEPGTWAMMLLGFAGAGLAIRRSRRRSSGLPQLA